MWRPLTRAGKRGGALRQVEKNGGIGASATFFENTRHGGAWSGGTRGPMPLGRADVAALYVFRAWVNARWARVRGEGGKTLPPRGLEGGRSEAILSIESIISAVLTVIMRAASPLDADQVFREDILADFSEFRRISKSDSNTHLRAHET